MDEFSLIRRYFAQGPVGPDVVLGIGDDCALLQVPPGQCLAVSLDTLVAGVHFPVDAKPYDIASRAICTALSDLAAMGARPLWITLGLTMPSADEPWMRDFCAGLFATAVQYQVALVGGDTTRGPLTISVQVHGAVAPQRALRRSGAKPGDSIYVTGTLGDGAAALALIQQEFEVTPAARDYLLERFYRPSPQLAAGQALAGLASACIDVSDGLCADLGHLCTASGVGARVDADRLPIAAVWREVASAQQRIHWALSGGDDYQLCFTVPAHRLPEVEALQQQGIIQATAIGTITHALGVVVTQAGEPFALAHTGYNHFNAC